MSGRPSRAEVLRVIRSALQDRVPAVTPGQAKAIRADRATAPVRPPLSDPDGGRRGD